MASATTAFLDEQGRPLLRESFAAFLDVLGFSHTVVSAAESKQSEQGLEAIARALGAARTFVRDSLGSDELANPEKWAVKFFSDNLLLGYPSDTGDTFAVARFVLKCAQRYQLQMTLSGFFVRGAITLGALCLTDDIIFGTALIESYRLESS